MTRSESQRALLITKRWMTSAANSTTEIDSKKLLLVSGTIIAVVLVRDPFQTGTIRECSMMISILLSTEIQPRLIPSSDRMLTRINIKKKETHRISSVGLRKALQI